VPQNRPRVLLVGIREDIHSASAFLRERGVRCLDGNFDARDWGFLPAAVPGAYPDLEDLLGDLEDEDIAPVLETGDYPRGEFKTADYPRKPGNKIQRELRSPPHWEPGLPVSLTDQEYSKHGKDTVEKFRHMINHGGELPPWTETRKFS